MYLQWSIRFGEISRHFEGPGTIIYIAWWRHQMETFSALLAICAGNSPVTGEFSAQRPVTRSFDVFFDIRLNKRFSKQWWGWWFETQSRSLWRHCNEHRYLWRITMLQRMYIFTVLGLVQTSFSISSLINSLATGKSFHYSSVSETTLKNMILMH